MSDPVADTGAELSVAEAARRLRRLGQRATPQRLMILGVLAPGEHLTADEVCARLGPLGATVNRATIYRTLERFRDLGLLSETDLGGGVRRFELLESSRHHHLICFDCGAMQELDDEVVAPLRVGIKDGYGFEPTIDHLALFGRCAACQSRRGGVRDGN